MKRAYSISDIRKMRPINPIDWGDEWEQAFGQPAQNEMWVITGPSASGKTLTMLVEAMSAEAASELAGDIASLISAKRD